MRDEADVCVTCGRSVKTEKKSVNSDNNIIGIIALIASFILPIAGLILGIIGYKNAKKTGGENKGMALAAIIISSVSMLLTLIGSILTAIISAATYGAFWSRLMDFISQIMNTYSSAGKII